MEGRDLTILYAHVTGIKSILNIITITEEKWIILFIIYI